MFNTVFMETFDVVKEAGGSGKLMPEALGNLEMWLRQDFLPDWARVSLQELVQREEWDELNDRFYRNMKFGTGGMRGRTIGAVTTAAETGAPSERGTPAHPSVGTNLLNDFNVIRATIGLFRYSEKFLAESELFDLPKLVIAHDVRHFSRYFCELAASTWTKLGGLALIFDGPRSTPMLSFAVRYLGCTAGINITASHNPPHDNGYKVYFIDGGQVVSPHAEGIISCVEAVAWSETADYLALDTSKVVELPQSVDEAYLDVLQDNVLDPDLFDNCAPKVVFTPIHGVGGVSTVPVLREYGVEVVEVPEQAEQDPRFPTVKSPNPENPSALAMALERAKETEADMVLATDPDGDRMAIAAKNASGEWVHFTGNMSGAMLAEYRVQQLRDMGFLSAESVGRAALIKTFVTTPLQEEIAVKNGLKCINTLTGFKWIGSRLHTYEKQLEAGIFEEEGIGLDYDQTDLSTRVGLQLEYSTFYVFGGEESYGYLASDRVRDKDANAACLMACELAAYLRKRGISAGEFLDEIYLQYGYYAESLLNLYMEGAKGTQQIRQIIESYRENPPEEINGWKVVKVIDFGRDDITDADGFPVPKEDFFMLELENGYRYAVRGSGTEPKIKFYSFACEKSVDADSLASIKEQTKEKIAKLEAALEENARQRAGAV